MGGIGSGRPGWRRCVTEFRALDVNALRRRGYLEVGSRHGWSWPMAGGRVCHVDLAASDATLNVDLLIGHGGGGWRQASHVVPLTWLPCAKGGRRPLFECPNERGGRPCGRRAVRMYLDGQRLKCSRCADLAYGSQSEGPEERLLRKARRLRARLGETEWRGIDRPLPPRPRGMHRRTHDRLVERLEEIEGRFCLLEEQRFNLATW